MTRLRGNIHSIENFGSVDGPGIRMVVFFQGCSLRCLYCHNPDTWSTKPATHMTVDEILARYERNRVYYQHGGITASGGEPLLQLPFLTNLFCAAQEQGIHTCLDTSGAPFTQTKEKEYEELARVTNLVLLDVKHSNEIRYQTIAGGKLAPTLDFAAFLDAHHVPIIVRHVVVPYLTNTPQQLQQLGKQLAKYTNICDIQALPYHTMGQQKYLELGLDIPLPATDALTQKEAHIARQIITEAYAAEKSSARL